MYAQPWSAHLVSNASPAKRFLSRVGAALFPSHRVLASTTMAAPVADAPNIVHSREHASLDLGLQVGAAWMQGRRRDMQDAHCVRFFTGAAQPHAILGVFDGHGRSEFAAKFGAEHLPKHIESWLNGRGASASMDDTDAIADGLKTAYLDTDADLAAASISSNEAHSGCTAHVAIILPSMLVIANAGDSRSVLVDSGHVSVNSKDHKPMDPEELARITKAGSIVTESGRVDGRLNLSRGLGDFDLKNAPVPPEKQPVSPAPDVRVVRRKPNTLLVIACDGLWDALSSKDVGKRAEQLLHRGLKPREIAAALVAEAYKLGSADNISVIVVHIE